MALFVCCRACGEPFHACRSCGRPEHQIEHSPPRDWPATIVIVGKPITLEPIEHHKFIDGAGHVFE